METSDQPEGPQQLHFLPSLQNGVHPDCQGPDQARRLAPEARPERRVPHSTDPPELPEIPQIQVAVPNLAVSGPSLWPQQRSSNLHEALEADCIHTPPVGDQVDSIPGRHAPDGQLAPGGHRDLSGSGVYNKHKEKHISAHTEVGIPRLPDRLPDHVYFAPSSEAPLYPDPCEADADPGEDDNPAISQGTGDDDSRPSCSATSPAALPSAREGEDTGSQERSHIQYISSCLSHDGGRPTVVGAELPGPQWQTTSDPSVGPDVRDRCIPGRMGGELPRPQRRGSLDSGRTDSPHKLPGAPGSFLTTEGFPPQQRSPVSSPAHGQRHSNSFPESHGGNTLPTPLQSSSGDMGMVYTEEVNHSRRAPAWNREHQGRLVITAPGRLQ